MQPRVIKILIDPFSAPLRLTSPCRANLLMPNAPLDHSNATEGAAAPTLRNTDLYKAIYIRMKQISMSETIRLGATRYLT